MVTPGEILHQLEEEAGQCDQEAAEMLRRLRGQTHTDDMPRQKAIRAPRGSPRAQYAE